MLRKTSFWSALAMAASVTASCLAAGGDAIVDADKAGPDFAVQGEYAGTLKKEDGDQKYGAQVIALGEGKFQAVLYSGGLPGDGWEKGQDLERADGATEGQTTKFSAAKWSATIDGETLAVSDSGGNELGGLKKIMRESPTLGAKPPEGATVLFDGSTAEHFEGGKMTEDKLLMVGSASKQSFGDFVMHLEFRTPFMSAARGQGRGNSGMYLQDRYEVQVLDSFGLEGKNNECGGIYGIQDPKVNMCYPPLAWQTYDVEFTAARFDDQGNKTKNAIVTLSHNGVPVYDHYELPNLTPGGAATEAPGKGPLKLQDHGNPVHFRNIWVLEKK